MTDQEIVEFVRKLDGQGVKSLLDTLIFDGRFSVFFVPEGRTYSDGRLMCSSEELEVKSGDDSVILWATGWINGFSRNVGEK